MALQALTLALLRVSSARAEPEPAGESLRPMRRIESADGITELTNSKLEPRPAPAAIVTRPLLPAPPARISLDEASEPPQPSESSSGWVPGALLAGLAALGFSWMRRRRTRRLEALPEARSDRTRLPPMALVRSSKERGEKEREAAAPQWVSQGPPSRRLRG